VDPREKVLSLWRVPDIQSASLQVLFPMGVLLPVWDHITGCSLGDGLSQQALALHFLCVFRRQPILPEFKSQLYYFCTA
jgi:hypothetical protein